jgi:guanylate kinase
VNQSPVQSLKANAPAKINSKGTSVQPGNIFIVSAPSGAGKTTLCKALREHFPDLVYSVSFTTRKPRLGEQHGVDYFFITQAEFIRRINADQWAEWARVHDNYYGTSTEYIEKWLHAGKDILLDIDVQGMLQMHKRYPDIITIFVMPPDVEALRERMAFRGADTDEVMNKRLSNAQSEMAQSGFYRHVIVNDLLEDAKRQLIELVEKCRKKTG